MPLDLLALDRTSARFYTEDGHLKVQVSHISKANICGYKGSEIPNSEALGLDPNRVYQLFRHPEELARAVGSFNSLPLLSKHRPVTAFDHPQNLVVGSTGTDAVFRNPYLDNSLVIWDAEAIQAVESGEQRQISCGYRYDADMTPGVWQGAPYDGIMTNIRGNHVALVTNGRAGADVVVMDSKESIVMSRIRTPSNRVAVARGALMAHLQSRLAQDSRINLGPILAGVTAANIDQRRTVIIDRLRKATEGKFAKGMALDAENIGELLESTALEDPAPTEMGAGGGHQGMSENEDPEGTNTGISEDADVADQIRALLSDKLDPAVLEQVMALMGPGAGGAPNEAASAAHEMAGGEAEAPGAMKPAAPEPEKPTAPAAPPIAAAAPHPAEAAKPAFPPKKADDAFAPGTQAPAFQPAHDRGGRMGPKGPPGVDRAAMDSAISRARRETETAVVARMNAIREAERFVQPWVGQLAVTMDSADAVLRYALDSMGEDVEGIHASAYKALLSKVPLPGAELPRISRLAQDSKSVAGFFERFPGAKRARVVG